MVGNAGQLARHGLLTVAIGPVGACSASQLGVKTNVAAPDATVQVGVWNQGGPAPLVAQVGVVNEAIANGVGFQLAASNDVRAACVQVAVVNRARDPHVLTGLQLGVLNVASDSVVQLGLVDLGDANVQIAGLVYGDNFRGLQLGLVTISANRAVGVQAAALAWARDVQGVQISLYNVADTVAGLQIGLVNCSKAGCSPLLGW